MLITAKQLLTQSFDLYKKHWKLLLTYAVPLVAITLPATLLPIFLPFFNNPTTPQTPLVLTSLTNLIIYLVSIAIASVLGVWFSIAILRVIGKLVEQDNFSENWKQNLSLSVKLIIPVAIASFLAGLIVLGGILLLVIPGIIFGVWYTFTMYEVVLSDKKIKESLSGSKALVKGRWWAVVWRIVAPSVVLMAISGALTFIAAIPVGLLGKVMGSFDNSYLARIPSIISLILSLSVNLLILPLTLIIPTILYLELKKTPIEVPPTIPSVQQ